MISVSSLNIGRYIDRMIVATMQPTMRKKRMMKHRRMHRHHHAR